MRTSRGQGPLFCIEYKYRRPVTAEDRSAEHGQLECNFSWRGHWFNLHAHTHTPVNYSSFNPRSFVTTARSAHLRPNATTWVWISTSHHTLATLQIKSLLPVCYSGQQSVPVKWYLIPSNGHSRAHKCDRRTDHATVISVAIVGMADVLVMPADNVQYSIQ